METYDTNIENFNSNREVDRLEREVDSANKKAKTFFESMKRATNENNDLHELINSTYEYLIYQRDVRLNRDPDLLTLIGKYESNGKK